MAGRSRAVHTMAGRSSVVHSRLRAMLLRAAQVRRRRRKVKLRRGGKARAECAQARDWKLLFPELMNHVLGLLPPRDVCRARAVCKYWNELVSSPAFVRQHVERAGNACMDVPTVAFFDFRDRPPVVGFHAELKRWVRLPALFAHNKDSHLVAATKGLYVYSVTSEDDREESWRSSDDDMAYFYKRTQLVVTNPWTGATKWLPLMLNERGPYFNFMDVGGPVFTLDVVDNGRAYIVTAINAHKQRGEVYDSRLGYWSAFNASVDPAIINFVNLSFLGAYTMKECVRLMGNLYFLADVRDHINSGYVSTYIMSFNLENRKWALVYDTLGAMPERFSHGKLGDREYQPWHLTTCGNKLVVVDVWSTKTEVDGRILILDVERKAVSEETPIPRSLARNMVVGSDPSYDCPGYLEVVSAGMGHLLHFFPSHDNKFTTYDFHTKMWRTWAPSPLCPESRRGSGHLVDVQLSLLPV